MEFCPKCGSVLVPKRVGRGARGICPRCGYKGKLKRPAAYKVMEKGKEAKEVKVIEKEEKKKKPPEREHEEIEVEYYEEEFEE